MDLSPAQNLALLRSQRHSFTNHLQVLSGWLQLDRPERARQYLEGLAARIASEGEVIRQVPPSLGLLVIMVGLEAETYGVQVEWRLQGPVSQGSDELLARWQAEAAEGLKAASLLPEERRKITVVIGPGADFRLHTPVPAGEG